MIRKIGPEGFEDIELITQQELNHIRQIWLNDKHEFDDSLPRIYEEVTGEQFISNDALAQSCFGETEWNILSEVCSDLYPDEQLLFETVARVVDVESRAAEQKTRRGIVGNIEAQIKRGFFKDESDAKQYAAEKILRKKKMGAAYDEKAEADPQMSLLEEEEA